MASSTVYKYRCQQVPFLSYLACDYAPLFDLPPRLRAEAKERRHNYRASRSSSRAGVFCDRPSETGSVIGSEAAFLVSYQGKWTMNMSCVEMREPEENSTDV